MKLIQIDAIHKNSIGYSLSCMIFITYSTGNLFHHNRHGWTHHIQSWLTESVHFGIVLPENVSFSFDF